MKYKPFALSLSKGQSEWQLELSEGPSQYCSPTPVRTELVEGPANRYGHAMSVPA
jgi:hypothetical protein